MIGRWTVDKAFLMYTRTHNMSIIDGTIFSSYHLGEDAAEKSMDKYVTSDWLYNRIIVNNTIADIEGRLKSKEVFCLLDICFNIYDEPIFSSCIVSQELFMIVIMLYHKEFVRSA